MSKRRAQGARVRFERVPVSAPAAGPASYAPVAINPVVPAVERQEAEPVTVTCQQHPGQHDMADGYVTPYAVAEPEVVVEPQEESTPTFDALIESPSFAHLPAEASEWDKVLAEPFKDWGLDATAPKPVPVMIADLVQRVGLHRAVAIERTIEAELLTRGLAEQEGEGDDDDNGSAGNPTGAEREGTGLVEGEGGADPLAQGVGGGGVPQGRAGAPDGGAGAG